MNGLDVEDPRNVPAGFALVLGTMGVVAAMLFVFFRKKQWILVRQRGDEDIDGSEKSAAAEKVAPGGKGRRPSEPAAA